MVKTLNISDDGNLTIDASGNLEVATDLEGLRQKLIQKLRFFRGEWFLDVIDGTPYFQEILTKPINMGLVTSILNNRIMSEPEVTGLGAVDSNLDPITRRFTYKANVITIFGETQVTV